MDWNQFGNNIFQTVGGFLGNQASARQAQENRDWLTYMSNTSHQREVNDLKKAGLNPILTATGGAGASTPSSAIASQENPVKGVDFYTAKQLQLQEKAINMDNSKKASEIHNIDQDTSNKLIQGSLMNEQIVLTQIQQNIATLEAKLKEKDLSWYDRKANTELITKLKNAEAQMITAQASKTSSSASMISAQAAKTSSSAAMINANVNAKWKPYEVGGKLLDDIGGLVLGGLGNKAKGLKKIGESVRSFTKKGVTTKNVKFHYGR